MSREFASLTTMLLYQPRILALNGMRHVIANWFNERGIRAHDKVRAIRFYQLASCVEPRWSVPWYNLGFQAKYSGRWRDSLRFNRRAVELNANDEGALWNMGIAATALRDWDEARRAWKGFGIDLVEGDGEVSIPPVTACVRLDPNHAGEVVWGKRLDPARILVLNIPLPASGRRYRDVILNDGAPNGTRDRNGTQVPVFDELEVWQPSCYSTFQATLNIPSPEAEEKLGDVCEARGVGLEDWSTIRMLCAECSLGNPQPHECKATAAPEDGTKRFGFAAKSRDELESLLINWASNVPSADYLDVELKLQA